MEPAHTTPRPAKRLASARVRCADRELSHPELHERAGRIAAGLLALGVQPGDRVALVLRNDCAYAEITLGLGLIGAVAVPVNWHFTGDDLAHVLVDSGCRVVFAHSGLATRVGRVAPGRTVIEVPVGPAAAAAQGIEQHAPDGSLPVYEPWLASYEPFDGAASAAPALGMLYTSGSTGAPKGVRRQPVSAAQATRLNALTALAFGLGGDERALIPAPLYHAVPHTHLVMALGLGNDLTLMPRFEPEEFLRLVEAHRIEHVQMVPTMFVRLLALPKAVRARYDLSSLRSVVHSAAPCPVEVKRAILDWFGPIVREYYGSTETGMVTWCDSRMWLEHPGTVGRPVVGASVLILGPDGEPLPAGEIGEVYVRPPRSWPGFTYQTAQGPTPVELRHGHLTLGDLGRVDGDGYLHLTGRGQDLVISGGVNIYPVEIEAALLSLPGVLDAAVFGIPDPEYGEALAAHVQADPAAGLTAEDVRTHVRSRLAGYKAPKAVVFEPELPREDTGKLRKAALRAPYWTGTGRSI
jgi:long-chain acyl-CoA synthetase